MKLLDKELYYRVAEPLAKVTYNHLFALAVTEHKIEGQVFVDNSEKPTSLYIVHPYGMSLLSGNYENEEFNNQLELGIESAPNYRGKGFAMHTCESLIDYCLEKGYEPIWSCRLENTGSYRLAQRLGFEPVLFHPFYKVDI